MQSSNNNNSKYTFILTDAEAETPEMTGMGEFNSDDHYIYYCG